MSAKKPKVIPPDDAEVPALTERLEVIVKEMAALKKERSEIEAKLSAWASNQEQIGLEDDQREGRQVPLVKADGSTAGRVVFQSDLMIGSFRDGGPVHGQILKVLELAATEERSAEQLLKLFYDPPNSWESRIDDGIRFRAAAAEWLPEDVAPQFIAACRQTDKYGIAKSRRVVEMA